MFIRKCLIKIDEKLTNAMIKIQEKIEADIHEAEDLEYLINESNALLENRQKELDVMRNEINKKITDYEMKVQLQKKELEANGKKWCEPDKNDIYMFIGSDGRRMTFDEMMDSDEYVLLFE